MSKNHRSRFRDKQRANTAALEQRASTPPKIFNAFGYDAANASAKRGWVQHFPLDTAKEATGYVRELLLKDSRWLVANDGYASFCVEGLSRLIGYYSVQPATKDKAWNRIAEAHLKNHNKSPSVFDRSGKLNHSTWQLAMSRRRLRDGDALDVLLRAESGRGMIVPYEGHQIGNGPQMKQDPRLIDGVTVDKYGRHMSYRLLDMQDRTKWATVDASSCVYYGDQTHTGRVRPVPPLAHAINDLKDLIEIGSEMKLGIKNRQYLGIYRKRQQAGGGPAGLFTEVTPMATDDSTSTTTTSDTGTTQKNLVNFEQAQEVNGIAGLGAGEDLGTISMDSPGPNEQQFMISRLEKVALGIGLPPSVVFMITGLTGPEVRLHMGLLKRWIEVELLRLLIAVQKHYFFWLASEMERGALPFPDDDEWWQAIYVPQADLTIDRGREGKLALEEMKVGATTLADIWEQKGADWEDKIEAQAMIISRASEIAAVNGLTLSDLMPGWKNPQIMQVEQQSLTQNSL